MTRPAKEKHCGQCGQSYTARACGPTHAMIANERKAGRPAKVKPVKAWAVKSDAVGLIEGDYGVMLFFTKRKAENYFFEQLGPGCKAVRVLIIEAPK